MRPIIILGGGGHAKVVLDALLASGREVIGFVDMDIERDDLLGYPRLGYEKDVFRRNPRNIFLANGIGSVGDPEVRIGSYMRFQKSGYEFIRVVHPSAIVGQGVRLAEGVQLMAGCVVQPDTEIGENSLINTGANVDHDCRIGAHVHIAPGATISGNVAVGDCAHVGTGARIIQGIEVGSGALVGAGSVVIRPVGANEIVMGVPAGKQ